MQILKRNLLFLSMLITGLGVTASLSAHEGGRHPVCREDIKKFCGDVKPGEGRMRECIEQNKSKFSSGCQQKMEKMHKIKEACQADRQKFCADVEKGRGKKFECFQSNWDKLSNECRSALEEHQKLKKSSQDSSNKSSK